MTKTRLVADSANANSIDGARLTNDSIPDGKLETGIDGEKLADNSITDSKIISIAASKSQFGPALSEALVRSVEDKLSDFVSVLDFVPESEHDAIRSGTSTYDCSAAIQNAIDNCSELTGGTVIFPPGIYKISTTIIHKPGVNLFGSSYTCTEIVSSVSPAVQSASGSCGACKVFGITIRVPFGPPNPTAYYVPQNSIVTRLTFEQCFLVSGFGFFSEGQLIEVEWRDSVITQCFKAVTVSGSGNVINNCAIRNCRINASGVVPNTNSGVILEIAPADSSSVLYIDNVVFEVGSVLINSPSGNFELIKIMGWCGDGPLANIQSFTVNNCNRVTIDTLQAQTHNVKVTNCTDVTLNSIFAWKFFFDGSTRVDATHLTAVVDAGAIPLDSPITRVWYEGDEYYTGFLAKRNSTILVPAQSSPGSGIIWTYTLAAPDRTGPVTRVWISPESSTSGTGTDYARLYVYNPAYGGTPAVQGMAVWDNSGATWQAHQLVLPTINSNRNKIFGDNQVILVRYEAVGTYQLPALTIGIEYEERGWL